MLSGAARRPYTGTANSSVKEQSILTSGLFPSLTETDKKFYGKCVGVLFAGYTLKQSVLMTNAGHIYVVQNNLSGKMDVHTEPGVHLRVPFFSNVARYRQVLTVTEHSPSVRFADTYTGVVPATFRFKLPLNPSHVIKLHTEFRSEGNLEEVLLKRNSQNVIIITATQYTGEEFFQGGLNSYKTQLQDQLSNGVYVTERKQVEIEQPELAPVRMDQNDSKKV